jgi:hypothetical protein
LGKGAHRGVTEKGKVMPGDDEPTTFLNPFEAELAHLPEEWAYQFRYRRDQHKPAARLAYQKKITARLKHARTKGLDVPYDERDKEEIAKDEEE